MKKKIMKKQEINDLHLLFWGKFKRFMFQYNIDFSFSLNTYEKCAITYDEIELVSMESMTESFFEYHKPWFNKLCRQLSLECSYKCMFELFEMYIYNNVLQVNISDYCNLSTRGLCGSEPLYDWEVLELAKKEKYNKKYFYEFTNCIDFGIVGLLKFCDSIRKELTDHGDTIENINNRDFTITLHKYYSYLSEGVNYADKA